MLWAECTKESDAVVLQKHNYRCSWISQMSILFKTFLDCEFWSMDRLPSSQSGVRRRRLRLESAAACKTESGRWRCLDSWKWDRQRVGRRPGKRWGAVYTARAGKGNCCRRARNIWNTSAGEKSRKRKRERESVCVCVRARAREREREREVCRKRRVELRLVV